MKFKLLIKRNYILYSVIVLLIGIFAVKLVFFSKENKVKNILVVSFCSVNANQLPIFGNAIEGKFPNMERVFRSSFNFINAYTDFSWSNIRRFLYKRERINNLTPDQIYQSHYYPSFEEWKVKNGGINVATFRIPKEVESTDFESYGTDLRLDEAFDGFKDLTKQIEDRIEKQDSKNLFYFHYKFMHYPYLPNSFFKDRKKMEQIFSIEELKLIDEYIKNPQNYPEKYSFFQATFPFHDRPNLFKNKNGQFITYVTEQNYINKWRSSKNYNLDFQIMVKSYQAKLELFDLLIGKWFDYYKEKLEEKGTLLVLTGDHGEALLEHESLTHNTKPYDEVIRFFFSYHLPYSQQFEMINQQVSQKMATTFIQQYFDDDFNLDSAYKFENYIKTNEDTIISMNCTGSVFSARLNNQWKLIYYPATDSYLLFDLLHDPIESKDVSAENPDIVSSLKVPILDRLSSLKFGDSLCVR